MMAVTLDLGLAGFVGHEKGGTLVYLVTGGGGFPHRDEWY